MDNLIKSKTLLSTHQQLMYECAFGRKKNTTSTLSSVVGGDHSRIVWLAENSYTTVSSHSVRVSIFELRVVVVEEHDCLVRLSMRY